MNKRELAEAIARDIFADGEEPYLNERGKVHRIAFMGGGSYKTEIPMGGFCEEALARSIEKSLRKHLPRTPAPSEGAGQ